jgi:hypothetical protein
VHEGRELQSTRLARQTSASRAIVRDLRDRVIVRLCQADPLTRIA